MVGFHCENNKAQPLHCFPSHPAHCSSVFVSVSPPSHSFSFISCFFFLSFSANYTLSLLNTLSPFRLNTKCFACCTLQYMRIASCSQRILQYLVSHLMEGVLNQNCSSVLILLFKSICRTVEKSLSHTFKGRPGSIKTCNSVFCCVC